MDKSRRGWLREIGGGPIAQDRWTPGWIGLIALLILIIILFLISAI